MRSGAEVMETAVAGSVVIKVAKTMVVEAVRWTEPIEDED